MSSEIVKPQDVDSPRLNWTLIKVLDEGTTDRAALALGQWEKKPVLAMRWNGTPEKPKGNPISTGCPTWFIVPDKFVEGILRSGLLSSSQMSYVLNFMNLKLIESFRGRIISPSTGPEYRIRRIERLSVLDGRDYVVRVEPILHLQNEKNSSTQALTIRIHLAHNEKSEGNTEEADGQLIIKTLADYLNTDLESRLPKNDEGQFQIHLF